MEQLNKIEIRGMVGTIKTQSYSQNTMSRITVATNYVYKDKTGAAVIETSWHNIIAWEGKNIADCSKIERGSKIYVQGRLKYNKYITEDGQERQVTEIIATRLVILDDDESLAYEM